MSKHFLHNLGVFAIGQKQRRRRLPQIVEANRGQFRPDQQRLEVLPVEMAATQGAAMLVAKHVSGPKVTGGKHPLAVVP